MGRAWALIVSKGGGGKRKKLMDFGWHQSRKEHLNLWELAICMRKSIRESATWTIFSIPSNRLRRITTCCCWVWRWNTHFPWRQRRPQGRGVPCGKLPIILGCNVGHDLILSDIFVDKDLLNAISLDMFFPYVQWYQWYPSIQLSIHLSIHPSIHLFEISALRMAINTSPMNSTTWFADFNIEFNDFPMKRPPFASGFPS